MKDGDTDTKSDITRSIQGSQLFMKKRKKMSAGTGNDGASASDNISDFSDNASDMRNPFIRKDTNTKDLRSKSQSS
jgi:hypothetical protein